MERDRSASRKPSQAAATRPASGRKAAGPPAQKRGPGAPRGNKNAAKHLAFSQRRAQDQRDRHKRGAERSWRQIVAEAGARGSAIAAESAKTGRGLSVVRDRLEEWIAARPIVDRRGNVCPAAVRFIEVCDRLAGKLEGIVETIGATREGDGREDRIYIAVMTGQVRGALTKDGCCARCGSRIEEYTPATARAFEPAAPPEPAGEAIAPAAEPMAAPALDPATARERHSDGGAVAAPAPEEAPAHPVGCPCRPCRLRRVPDRPDFSEPAEARPVTKPDTGQDSRSPDVRAWLRGDDLED